MARYRAAFVDPQGARYGIPTFPWRSARPTTPPPASSAPLALGPGGQPVAAQILWRGVGGTRAAYLYRVDLAAPKRTATPRQRAAIDRALTARRTWATCAEIRPYFIPRSLGECLSCANA